MFCWKIFRFSGNLVASKTLNMIKIVLLLLVVKFGILNGQQGMDFRPNIKCIIKPSIIFIWFKEPIIRVNTFAINQIDGSSGNLIAIVIKHAMKLAKYALNMNMIKMIIWSCWLIGWRSLIVYYSNLLHLDV